MPQGREGSLGSIGEVQSTGFPQPNARPLALAAFIGALIALALAAGGCGGGEENSTSSSGEVTQNPDGAAEPTADLFPQPDGKTLRQLTANVRPGPNFVPGTGTYVPGENRVAFGLLSRSNEVLYAPTAVYVARTPSSPAQGPFLAPADSLVTDAPYKSQTAAGEDDPYASIYAADLPLPKDGDWSLLTLSSVEGQMYGATGTLRVAASSPIPEVGDPAPETSTETVADVGDIKQIDTRVPPDDMHDVDAAEVVGQKPVALLFATPALCESRVCGPVTDIAAQLKATYGDQVEFIHQEVYNDNDPTKGLRQPLLDYGLRSEPWLFTIDSDGRIAARLEGSFGVGEFEEAVQAAIG